MLEGKGHCEHGDFNVREGCQQCIAERKAEAEVYSPENIAKRIAEVQPELNIVKVCFFSQAQSNYSGTQYAYFSKEPLKVGDIVMAPVRGGTTSKAMVSAIGVNEGDIAAFKERVKTIPADSLIPPEPESSITLTGKSDDAEITMLSPEMEGTAVVMVDAGKAPSFAKHLEAARRVLEIAKSCEIRTEADAKAVNDDLNVMAELEKASDAERKTFTVPLNGYLSSINGAYKLITEPLTEAKQIYRKLLTVYKVEQQKKAEEVEKLNRDAMDVARRQAEANNGEFTTETKPVPVPYAPKVTRTDQGKSSLIDVWKYEIVDIKALSREYMIPDDAMLSSIAKTHHDKKEVEGVRFFNSPSLRVSR